MCGVCHVVWLKVKSVFFSKVVLQANNLQLLATVVGYCVLVDCFSLGSVII